MNGNLDDARFMQRALELAERGWGRVAPNPMVGAVVVGEGRVVGEGYHSEWGGPHAEVAALRAAGAATPGATIYVNLEPCAHTGKTGPCTLAIQQAGIARVVAAVEDPDSRAGGGARWLREQGIEVVTGVCAREASDLNAAHLTASRYRQPFIALKYAMSLDARLAEEPGRPTQVTGGAATREAHRLRAGHDVVLVGIDTALADDPALTVREWDAPRLPPTRAVVDSDLRLPGDSKLARTVDAAPVCVFAAEDAPAARASELEGLGLEIERVGRSPEGGLDLASVRARLWERGSRSILCEGGGALGSALLAAGLVDRIYAFIAPRLFGEPGVMAFAGGRGRAPRDWRLVKRMPLDDVTLLVLAPSQASREEIRTEDV